jgi:hypothetical protein
VNSGDEHLDRFGGFVGDNECEPGSSARRSVTGDPGIVNQLVAGDGIVEGIPGLDVQRIRRA